MADRNNDEALTEEEVDVASRPVAAVTFSEKNGQKEVSFVLRRSAQSKLVEVDASRTKKDGQRDSDEFQCNVTGDVLWEFAWCTFLDDNNFSLLAAVVNEHAPGVCYAPENLMAAAAGHRSAKKFLAALSICEVVSKPSSHFKWSQDKSFFLGLVGKANMTFVHGLEKSALAASCVACLVRHEVPRDGTEVDGSHRVVPLDSSRHMKLDHAAVAALHLFPASKNEDRFNSLFGMLNVCKTKKIGARLLERWIRQPLLSVDTITERQNLVEVNIPSCFETDPVICSALTFRMCTLGVRGRAARSSKLARRTPQRYSRLAAHCEKI